jgi:hypothetical protein
MMSLSATAQADIDIRILNSDTAVCDEFRFDILVYLKGDNIEKYRLKYYYLMYADSVKDETIADYKTDEEDYANLMTNKNNIYSIKISDKLKPGERYRKGKFVLVELITTGRGNFTLNYERTITMHATPKAIIETPDSVCGYDVELVANEQWSDISTYKWELVDGDEGELSFDDNSRALLKMPTNTIELQKPKIKLTETTGGLCPMERTKTIVVKGRPNASISSPKDDISLCSAIPNDPNFNFDATLNVNGQYPFKYKLSNGEEGKLDRQGESTVDVTMKEGGFLTIETITDKLGCTSNEADLTGGITVIDRKPQLTAPTDTLPVEGLNFDIPLPFDDVANRHELVKADDFASYDMSTDVVTSADKVTGKVESNMAGILGFYYIETNTDGDDCVNKVPIYVDATIPVRNPDGFSPNDDGKNDCLVFEGLPAKNKLVVFDSKGKIVYEKENYLNDWNAEGLEDGYYTYVLEGTGFKTLRETLVIKRK